MSRLFKKIRNSKMIINIRFFIPLLFKLNPLSVICTILSGLIWSFSSLFWVYFPKEIIELLMDSNNPNQKQDLIKIVIIFVSIQFLTNVLTKINDNHYKPFRFSLGDKVVGTLNFRSYVGKSFLDVRKDNINSIKIPIEVRSKKIDYFNQYSAMIADLSQHALSLIFEVNSPLYQEFELDLRDKKTYYEDFMFLEYLFREDNLPSIFSSSTNLL